MEMILVSLTMIGFAIFVLLNAIIIIKGEEVAIVERLGKFEKSITSGLVLIIPFFDNVNMEIDS